MTPLVTFGAHSNEPDKLIYNFTYTRYTEIAYFHIDIPWYFLTPVGGPKEYVINRPDI